MGCVVQSETGASEVKDAEVVEDEEVVMEEEAAAYVPPPALQ